MRRDDSQGLSARLPGAQLNTGRLLHLPGNALPAQAAGGLELWSLPRVVVWLGRT